MRKIFGNGLHRLKKSWKIDFMLENYFMIIKFKCFKPEYFAKALHNI